jgi:Protein of unknown function (DUF3054)
VRARAAELGSRRAALAIVLDLVVLIGFAAVGRRSHGEGGALADTLAVAWPFVVAWLAVAGASHALVQIAPLPAALSWLAAWPLALILRALSGRGDAPSFAVVALVVPLVALTGWRVAARLALR